MKDIKLTVEKIGTQWVYTSKDVPGLYSAHKDKATARKGVEPLVAMIKRMEARVAEGRRRPSDLLDRPPR